MPQMLTKKRRHASEAAAAPPRLAAATQQAKPPKPGKPAAALFHPAVSAWFGAWFAARRAVQVQAWPAIQSGCNVLIAAPTGSGKTLAAFLAAIDALVREGLRSGLNDETQIVYVSPLKALSNDIQKNLE